LPLARGSALDGFRPDRYDISGALICLLGAAIRHSTMIESPSVEVLKREAPARVSPLQGARAVSDGKEADVGHSH
jgi:hypothetical protein